MLIQIRERQPAADGSNATVSFDNEGEYPITISDPFSDKEEALLEWYFEDHLKFPFTRKVDAQTAAASIKAYGEALFKQLFTDPEAYARYKEGVQTGINTLQFEIAGSPEFHKLHWEALKDPKLPNALTLDAPMVRKNLVPQPVRARPRSSPTINLLIVTARPHGGRDVGYRTISRPLVEGLRQANVRVQIDILRPGTYQALVRHLEAMRDRHGAGYYHVVHFDVHGALLTYEQLEKGMESDRFLYQARYGRADIQAYEGYKAFLFLEGHKENEADPVEAEELAGLLQIHQVPIVVLNACQSGKQVGASETSLGSRLMQAGMQMVLAMGYSVTVSAAELMMSHLYKGVFEGQDLSFAIRRARRELHDRKGRCAYFNQTIDLEDWLLPVVYQNQSVRLEVADFGTAEEEAAYFERQAVRYPFPTPTYGFFGRDLDILNIEKRLLSSEPDRQPDHNELLVRGMGGAGKTTLLHHLGAWWQTTQFVDQVFYFGYDEKAWTRQQIMQEIAQRLFTPVEMAKFQPLSLDAQQARLAERLRADRHLLVLDNLESITGNSLAIPNTLPPNEQQALHSFLKSLEGGKTVVLLGSRSGEAWLAPNTFGDNIYELPGLDPEASSMLAERILEKRGAMQYRQDPDFQKLLKLLAGYPLAMEATLANLAKETPTKVLKALQEGDVNIDPTERIIRCIEYSHSNLSSEARGLLACLAPFTSVIDGRMIERYSRQLQHQPSLSHLPFERWLSVVQEAINWGLLNQHPQAPGFFQIQPIFPYFLRSRIGTVEQTEIRMAIETAFRQHYSDICRELARLIRSKNAKEKMLGQILVCLEYENLITALNMALNAQLTIINIYVAISSYLDSIEDYHRCLELSQEVLKQLESYPVESLAGGLVDDLITVVEIIARQQLILKQYGPAEAMYKRQLALLMGNQRIFAKQRIKQESSFI